MKLTSLTTAVVLALAGYMSSEDAQLEDANGHTQKTFGAWRAMLEHAPITDVERRYLRNEYKINYVELPLAIQDFLSSKVVVEETATSDSDNTEDNIAEEDGNTGLDVPPNSEEDNDEKEEENEDDDTDDDTDADTSLDRKELLAEAKALGFKKKDVKNLSDEDLAKAIEERKANAQ